MNYCAHLRVRHHRGLVLRDLDNGETVKLDDSIRNWQTVSRSILGAGEQTYGLSFRPTCVPTSYAWARQGIVQGA